MTKIMLELQFLKFEENSNKESLEKNYYKDN